MRIPRLFVDLPLVLNQTCELPSSRAHYLIKVLRLQAGGQLIVFNGQGGEYRATLTIAAIKQATISINGFIADDKESPLKSELAIGVSKGERMDWVVQKATELGVNTISPLVTERTELKLNKERWQKKIAYWQEIAISACEQCGRNRPPQVQAPGGFSEFIAGCSASSKLMLSSQTESIAIEQMKQPDRVCVLIGPEGGFSEIEIIHAEQAGFAAWSLGPRILRTETAPVVALSLLQSLYGDLSL